MTLRSMTLLILAFGCISAPVLRADDVYIYPAKNQSPEQQEKDKYECYQFGKSQTGFDPMAAPQATAAAPEKKGGLLKGAAGGALVGAAVGAVSGDVGKGAGYGAAAGGTIGALRKRSSEKEQEQYQQQQTANYQAQRQNYDRAYAACLEGRGYTVK
jgi:predicted lipid-binding transport protein (Tim44 family)